MKTCYVCHVVDVIGEQIVSTFLAPSIKFAKRQFIQMVDGTKGVLPDDFRLIVGCNVDIYESFNETSDVVGISYVEAKDEV